MRKVLLSILMFCLPLVAFSATDLKTSSETTNTYRYTIQLLADHNLNTIHNFVEEYDLKSETTVVEKNIENQRWYVLLYGQYKTFPEAQSALKEIKNDFSGVSPQIRDQASMQKEIVAALDHRNSLGNTTNPEEKSTQVPTRAVSNTSSSKIATAATTKQAMTEEESSDEDYEDGEEAVPAKVASTTPHARSPQTAMAQSSMPVTETKLAEATVPKTQNKLPQLAEATPNKTVRSQSSEQAKKAAATRKEGQQPSVEINKDGSIEILNNKGASDPTNPQVLSEPVNMHYFDHDDPDKLQA
ncbi:MAG: SPOR domain-containing protein, partial [Proteobacteria bacterium]|nr:SPOR domain-containing protein [Pseudomonadota bacterium]